MAKTPYTKQNSDDTVSFTAGREEDRIGHMVSNLVRLNLLTK